MVIFRRDTNDSSAAEKEQQGPMKKMLVMVI
jgi:hypothetical protein